MTHVHNFVALFLIISMFLFIASFSTVENVKIQTVYEVVEKEVIKYVSPDADSVVIPNGSPIRTNELEKPLREMSGFGYRKNPFDKEQVQYHPGFDIGCKQGTEIMSTADGRIIRVQYSSTGYGNNIIIEHTNSSYKTLYAHLSSVSIKVGQYVKKGDVIGYVGSTGYSTCPHLHYEIAHNNRKVDPYLYF